LKSKSLRAREAGFAPPRGRPYLGYMTDRPKRPRDANQLAKFIVDVATGEEPSMAKDAGKAKGGRVGAERRAASLSAEQRSQIARDAAAARWKKSD